MSGSFRRQVQVFVDQNLSPAARSARLAAAAIEGRDELIRSGRASPRFATYVDGREGAAEAGVRPEGAIVYRFSQLGEAAVFAMAFLRQRWPVKSAEYRNAFVYAIGQNDRGARGQVLAQRYASSRIIREGSFNPQLIDDGNEVLIFNRAPFARKADVQLVGGRRLRFTIPAGSFDDAAAAVRRRFPTLDARRIYTIRFPGQYVLKGTKHAGNPVESPALVISARS